MGQTRSVIVDCAVYEDGSRAPGELALTDAFAAARANDKRFVWIGLHEPTAEELADVAAEFQLHPLAVEDALKAHQRAKMERYDDVMVLVLKTACIRSGDVQIGHLFVFIGASFVVSVRHGVAAPLHDVRGSLEDRPELLREGPGAVLHAIVDKVVDEYEVVLEELDDGIDELAALVFRPERPHLTQRIYRMKTELLEFRRAVIPLAAPMDRLVAGEWQWSTPVLQPYFRDVHDHVLRTGEHVEQLDRMLSGVFDAQQTRLTVQQNDDMRKISAWVAIAAVPTSIGAIYGMNFLHMPELNWLYGYPLALGLMATGAIWLYVVFKRSGWL
ncbi:MAG: magnesium transporter CorA [Frankiales bacterium]|nr:magnesium transporter CorA [Frankiales bacterium]